MSAFRCVAWLACRHDIFGAMRTTHCQREHVILLKWPCDSAICAAITVRSKNLLPLRIGEGIGHGCMAGPATFGGKALAFSVCICARPTLFCQIGLLSAFAFLIRISSVVRAACSGITVWVTSTPFGYSFFRAFTTIVAVVPTLILRLPIVLSCCQQRYFTRAY